MQEGATNGTINRELSALKRMLSLGIKQTPPIVERIPYIPRLKENNIRKGFFEHAEFTAVRKELPDYLKGFATFAYKVGWRSPEIINLTWTNVAMMISGHKTRSVFDRYNIVNDADLKAAAKRQENYLANFTGTISGTIADFPIKKGGRR
jgi:hypothetical protein